MKKLLWLMAFFSLVQFTKPPKEGIRGQILWMRSDQMSGRSKTIAPELGVAREVLVYKVTTLNEVNQKEDFFHDIKTELVTKLWSEQDGSFKIKLPPGEYSVFTQEPKGLYASVIDQNGCIGCVTVKPKKYSWVAIAIDYEVEY